jgi:LEA14-like dessication related protein
MQYPWKVWWLLPVLACTPLGLWIYDDPRVTVSRVRVAVQGRGTAPVEVALDVNNPNNYPLSTTRVELRLSIDDVPIGRVERDSSVELPMGSATLDLPLVPDGSTTPAQLQALSSGVHRFTIQGLATLATPLGKREVPFAQEGELAFGMPASPASAPDDPGE